MDSIHFTNLVNSFSYDPQTGHVIHKTKNKIAQSKNKGGYLTLHFQKKNHYLHRVAWAITHGYFPDSAIDHINGDKTDNRLCNLRLVSASENGQNRKNVLGYTKPKQTKKWAASIMVKRKRKHLGYFDTKEMAHQAYLEAKKIYHPTAPC